MGMSNIKLLHNKVLAKPIVIKKSEGGIILPEGWQKKNRAEIVKIGTKVTELEVGMTILYHEHSGSPLRFNGEDYLLLSVDNPRDIISKLVTKKVSI